MNYYKKYIVLAILGSLIIGMACYLFLNNYLDRQEILVAAKDIEKGRKIGEDDLCFKEYYKNSLPESYLTRKEDAVGRVINLDRKKDDYISMDMFGEESQKSIVYSLGKDEVLVSINVEYFEPLLGEIEIGKHISIVSTERDNDLAGLWDSLKISNGGKEAYGYSGYSLDDIDDVDDIDNEDIDNKYFHDYWNNYLDIATHKLSENVLLVDGQLMVRNLEVVSIKKNLVASGNVLINSNQNLVSVYIKCSLKEVPIVARLTKEGNYRIVVENL